MTNTEAKKILESYIACESKKAHFECSEYNCDDSCPLLYEMGTVGEFNEAINMGIKALEQEPCEDAISREDVINLKWRGEASEEFLEGYANAIEDARVLPSVKQQEPKTGHWIDTGSGQECSECHEIQYGYDNHRFYCGNCGARMEVEQNG